jgi:CRISPR system Cascade subunit CasE
MPGELRMLRMRFDARKLFELGRRRRLPMRDADLGYLLHCQLKELFGENAPSPFFVQDDRGRQVTVLAYGRRSRDELERHAARFADPAVHEACDFASISEKPMPVEWPAGLRVGFDVRACPVVRLASGVGPYGKGAEVDAFLVRCAREEGKPIDRGAVYREWFAAEVDRRGGARLVAAEVTAFQRDNVVRRTQGDERRARVGGRPDVRFAGVLEVADGARFNSLLERGIGRHRAFGFGMLLLRPAG